MAVSKPRKVGLRQPVWKTSRLRRADGKSWKCRGGPFDKCIIFVAETFWFMLGGYVGRYKEGQWEGK